MPKLGITPSLYESTFVVLVCIDKSTVPTRFLPLTVSVIVRVRGKLVRLELEVTC